MSRTSTSDQQSTASRVRSLMADIIELVQVRFELLTVEARQEMQRLGQMAMFGALAITLLSFGLIFLAIFLTVFFWDNHRLWALGICTAVFLCGGGVLLALAVARFKEGARMFAGTREELKLDQERLRS